MTSKRLSKRAKVSYSVICGEGQRVRGYWNKCYSMCWLPGKTAPLTKWNRKVKKYILQGLSLGLREYGNMMRKYDKALITVTERNWKCCTLYREFTFFFQSTSTPIAVKVIFSVLLYFAWGYLRNKKGKKVVEAIILRGKWIIVVIFLTFQDFTPLESQ